MKLFYKAILAATAISMVAFVSCNKNDDPYDDDDEYIAEEIVEPVFKEQALFLTLSDKEDNTVVSKNGRVIEGLEFTESGYALLYVKDADIVKSATKAAQSGEVICLSYTFTDGAYKVADFGTVTIAGDNVTIKPGTGVHAPEAEVTVPAKVKKSSGTFNKIFSSWKIITTDVDVEGTNFSVDHEFTGDKASSLYEMAQYVNEKKQVIDADELKGYVVETITFTQNGTFVVKFKDADPYVGNFTLNGTKFHYEITSDVGGNFAFNAEADGTVSISEKTNLCELKIEGSFTHGSDTYDTEIEFDLEQVANVN